MTTRSTQARKLAHHLTAVAGTTVEVAHHNRAIWEVIWSDGPTRDEMRAHLQTALAGPDFPDMRNRDLVIQRDWPLQSWAALAIFARGDATVARQIHARVERFHQDRTYRPKGTTYGEMAMQECMRELFEAVAHPDRPIHPKDEPLIKMLLDEGRGDASRMLHTLLHTDRIPDPGSPRECSQILDQSRI